MMRTRIYIVVVLPLFAVVLIALSQLRPVAVLTLPSWDINGKHVSPLSLMVVGGEEKKRSRGILYPAYSNDERSLQRSLQEAEASAKRLK